MTENEENFDALESIIKIEPEEFQVIQNLDTRQVADEIPKIKAEV